MSRYPDDFRGTPYDKDPPDISPYVEWVLDDYLSPELEEVLKKPRLDQDELVWVREFYNEVKAATEKYVESSIGYHDISWNDIGWIIDDLLKRRGLNPIPLKFVKEGLGKVLKGLWHGAPGSAERRQSATKHAKKLMKKGDDRLTAMTKTKEKFAEDDYHDRKAKRTAKYNDLHGVKMEVCSACGGSGYYDDNGSPPCSSCNGTGKTRQETPGQKLKYIRQAVVNKLNNQYSRHWGGYLRPDEALIIADMGGIIDKKRLAVLKAKKDAGNMAPSWTYFDVQPGSELERMLPTKSKKRVKETMIKENSLGDPGIPRHTIPVKVTPDQLRTLIKQRGLTKHQGHGTEEFSWWIDKDGIAWGASGKNFFWAFEPEQKLNQIAAESMVRPEVGDWVNWTSTSGDRVRGQIVEQRGENRTIIDAGAGNVIRDLREARLSGVREWTDD